MAKSDLVDIAVQIKHETRAAYLVNDGVQDTWVPKSQCEIAVDRFNPSMGILTLPQWLAQEKELI